MLITFVVASAALATAGNAAPSVPTTSAAGTHREPLTGTWTGELTGQSGTGVQRVRIVIVVNARETGGSWKLSPSCHGPLALDTISNGYHHYLRKPSPGATCAGGDVDCLKQAGSNLYDAVTSHLGGDHDVSGMLRRALPR